MEEEKMLPGQTSELEEELKAKNIEMSISRQTNKILELKPSGR